MKARNLILISLVSLLMIPNAFAQTGVASNSQYGHGADSIRCLENINIFIPYAKAKNFQDAYPAWQMVYDECPASNRNVYLYGVQILDWKIAQEKDPQKRLDLINELMGVYDNRVKFFGNDPRYGKDWIIGKKIFDYLRFMPDQGDPKVIYDWTKEVIDEFGNKTDMNVVGYYLYASNVLMNQDEANKAQFINDYLKASEIYEAQIVEATAANNEKDLQTLVTAKANADAGFANSGAADCETLQNIYADKIEQNKDNLEFLKETIALLRRMRCQEIDAYFLASDYAHRIQPTSESAIGLGRQAMKKGEDDTAIKYFEEALSYDADDDTKGELYYTLATVAYNEKNYSKTRQYARSAIEVKPNLGGAYILIGMAYASTATSVYPNDPVLQKTVYFAAVDKFEKARQVDSSVAAEATKLINQYRGYFPSNEDIFMHPEIEKGKSFTVGGWIGETTMIR